MTAAEVVSVLDARAAAGCRAWLSGGWGVDALAGSQTRPHRDLDLEIDARDEARVLAALRGLGYEVETDWRPTRVELGAPGRGWVDLHPLAYAGDGTGVQTGLQGERYLYPADCFVTGVVAGRTVGCLSVAQQIAWHDGYPLRDIDHADLAVLRALDRRLSR